MTELELFRQHFRHADIYNAIDSNPKFAHLAFICTGGVHDFRIKGECERIFCANVQDGQILYYGCIQKGGYSSHPGELPECLACVRQVSERLVFLQKNMTICEGCPSVGVEF